MGCFYQPYAHTHILTYALAISPLWIALFGRLFALLAAIVSDRFESLTANWS